GAGLGPEGVVGTAAAGRAGAPSGQLPCGQAVGLAPGIQDVCAGLCAATVPDRAEWPTAGLSVALVEPLPADLFPVGRCAALSRPASTKSASGRADPTAASRATNAERDKADANAKRRHA